MKKITRTHDSLYLKENRYEEPKQVHMDIISNIKTKENINDDIVISDFGCAAGEFVYALRKNFPKAKIEGYDVLDELIEKAKIEVPNVDFFVGSIVDREMCKREHANVALCLGVLPIFDTFENIINNLLYWTKSGGVIFIHGLFNDFPIDVNIKYNLSENYGKNELEAGWNIFSKKTISDWLKYNHEVQEYKFDDFNLNIDLEPNEDPVRSWTIKNESGNRMITNGLCLLQPHSILYIKKI